MYATGRKSPQFLNQEGPQSASRTAQENLICAPLSLVLNSDLAAVGDFPAGQSTRRGTGRGSDVIQGDTEHKITTFHPLQKFIRW